MKRLILLTTTLFVLSSVLYPQVTPGVPPFSSTTSGPDVTNLGSLNVHFSMPVFHKPGRNMPFTFDLSYDTSVWYPVGSSGNQSWQPVGTWGWTAQTQAAIGYISYNTSTGGPVACNPPYDNSPRYFTIYSGFVYHDIFGNSHAFSASVSTMDQSCSTASSQPPPSASSLASDGSGFTLNASANSTAPSANIITFDGGQISPPVGNPGGSGTTTDRNGNQISVDGSGHITDTLATTALTISGTAPNPVVMTYTDSNNQPQHVTINYVSYTVETYFQCSGVHEYAPTSVSLVDNITYPDGSRYHFQYEATPNGSGHVTGRLWKITFPSGGTITYTYQGIVCTDGSVPALTRQTPDGTTTYARSNVSGSEWTTSITDPLGNLTQVWTQNWQTNSYETKRQISQLVNGNQVLLRTIYTCYNGATGDCSATALNLPITQRSIVTQLDNNWESEVNTQYNGYMLPTETDEYDWGNGTPGTLLRKTITAYAGLGNGIIDQVSSVTIQDGNGNQKALTNYYYDQGTLTTTNGVPQHVAVTGSRGNLTEISQWLNTNGSYLNTTMTYDDTGNLISTVDPNNQGIPNPPTTTLAYSNSNAYVTRITLPQTGSVQHITSATYDSNTGLVTSTTDQNGNITNYIYDCMLRQVRASFPDGGEIDTGYNSTPNLSNPLSNPPCTTILPSYVETKHKQDASNWIDQFTYFDGLGRVNKALLTDPEGNDEVDTVYDANGRTYSVTNPYRSTSDSTYGLTRYAYDALNRVTQVTDPDGNQSSVSYSGQFETITDEAGRSRQLWFDGLGRLTTTNEPNPANGTWSGYFPTYYTYDTLDNLTYVNQVGDGSGSRTRSFGYDSLSRLTSETTPEAGTTNYSYDSNGNLTSRTDARNLTTNFYYDVLNRLTAKDGNDGYPDWYYYDESSVWGWSLWNPIGRLTHTSGHGGNANDVYSYDQMGRMVAFLSAPPSIAGHGVFQSYAGYDLAGHLTSVSYPSGRKVTESYTSAGRLLKVNFDSFNSTSVNYPYLTVPQSTLASGWGYFPNGAPHLGNYGNGVTDTMTYNNRLQVSQLITANAQTLRSKSYGWYNGSNQDNGNIQTITDALNSAHNQSFGYDYLNRLTSATQADGSFNQTFTPDPWGNMKQAGAPSFNQNFDSNNRIIGSVGSCTYSTQTYCYDVAGKMIWDTFHQYAYDSQGRMQSVDSGATNYTYDANDNRVRKDVTGSDPMEYIYFGSEPIAEYDPNTGAWTDYVYGNAGLLARATGSASTGTSYYHADHLGSTRLITDASGNIAANCTYAPFGQLVGCSPSVSWNHYSFTGDEHDSESNTEHTQFRQLSTTQGRWLSPDPYMGSMDLTNPQSLNRYSYVTNNPLNSTDPIGLCPECRPILDVPDPCPWCTSFSFAGVPVYGYGYGWLPWNDGISGSFSTGSYSSGDTTITILPPTEYLGWGWVQVGTGLDVSPFFSTLRSATRDDQGGADAASTSITSKVSVGYTANVILPIFYGSLGPAFAYTRIPSLNLSCVGGGFGASAGHNFSFGPTVVSTKDAKNILSSWSFSAGYNFTPWWGAGGSGNSSGVASGNTFGVPGAGAAVTWSKCW